MKIYGLVGFPLTHSFSKKYFTEKFNKEEITDCEYQNFEIPDINLFPSVIHNNPELQGLNVTIPYKQLVIPFLNELDVSAKFVEAVNVIKIGTNNKLTGYNSDYYGFIVSLKEFLPVDHKLKALILGTGGAAKAVEGALKTLEIEYQYVSRDKPGLTSYADLTNEIMNEYKLIINTTPLGMYPDTATCPAIMFECITNQHYLYDLVYNPEVTLFMREGIKRGAKVKNGSEMLHLQAEKAWEIWNS